MLFGSNVCIWRLRPLICRQSHTGFFYCKGGSTYFLDAKCYYFNGHWIKCCPQTNKSSRQTEEKCLHIHKDRIHPYIFQNCGGCGRLSAVECYFWLVPWLSMIIRKKRRERKYICIFPKWAVEFATFPSRISCVIKVVNRGHVCAVQLAWHSICCRLLTRRCMCHQSPWGSFFLQIMILSIFLDFFKTLFYEKKCQLVPAQNTSFGPQNIDLLGKRAKESSCVNNPAWDNRISKSLSGRRRKRWNFSLNNGSLNKDDDIIWMHTRAYTYRLGSQSLRGCNWWE